MENIKLQKILNLVDEYIIEKHSSKKWIAGKDYVQYAGNYYDSNEYKSAIKTLLNEWLVSGEETSKFEKEFPKFFGKSLGIATNSGSSANLLMMASMKSKNLYRFPDKTKVLVPIAGFPTTINPIIQNNFTPIFCDIELDTLNIDLDEAEKLLDEHKDIKIITFAHVLGNCADINRLMELVKNYNLILLEDCCDALGSTYDGKYLGSFGEMASCSFYPAHHITCGEGGFVSCNNKEQERVLRSLRDWGRGCYCSGKNTGLSKNGCCGKRFSNWLPSLPNQILDHKYLYNEVGYNLKPIELQCSILLEQLKKLPDITQKRKENYKILYDIFQPYEKFFILPKAQEKADVNWFAFPLTVKNKSPFKKSDLTNYLENQKIQTRNYFGGNILLQPAYNNLGYTNEYALSFKNATKVTTDTFFLGVWPGLMYEQLNYIKNIIDEFMKKL